MNINQLIDKTKPWGYISFKDASGQSHTFYTGINKWTGDRLSGVDNNPPSINDDMKWIKQVFARIWEREDVQEYQGVKTFDLNTNNTIQQKMKGKTLAEQAREVYAAGLDRVKNTPVPEGQKYAPGTRVRIADDLGSSMQFFPKGRNATVKYTYAHAYGKEDVESYCLDIDGHGEVSWYKEHQLTPI